MTVRDPRFYAAWKEEEHAVHFDGLRFIPTPLLVRRWEGFNEIRLLADLLRREPRATVLEVGCATGEMYRYVARRHPAATYIGADISEPAIARAREKLGARARFIVTDPALAALDGLAPDIVFCRDVLHHQTEPWPFLERLYRPAGRGPPPCARSRAKGETGCSPAPSCERPAGGRGPLSILNFHEGGDGVS